MICSCCGYEIEDKGHLTENGKKSVCERCWNNPDLFFPEKIKGDARLKILSEISRERRNQSGPINIKVIRLNQKDIKMYIGKMKAKDILELFEIDKFKEEELEGYQRNQYEERTSELVEYLAECPLAIMPALLVSLRETEFNSQDGDFGVLKIPRRKGAIWIIDGQHRIGGFSKVHDRFVFSKSIDPELFPDLMNYEFPVVFIDSAAAAKRIGNTLVSPKNDFSSEDVERTIFFIVNKTQKGIHPSLKDALLYRIDASGIQGLPIIRKESWRIRAARAAINLNRNENSSLINKINISGRRGTGRPIQLNSFVSSLRMLFRDESFSKLNNDDKLKFVRTYWNALMEMFPQTFGEKTHKDYMLLKALGVHSLNWLATDAFQICLKRSYDFGDVETLKNLLAPLSSFDWSIQTSPLSSLGGMKGAGKAHGLLLARLNQHTELPDEKQTLHNHIK